MKAFARPSFWLSLTCLHFPCLPAVEAAPLQSNELAVGHWVELKGDLNEDGVFWVSEIEVLDPEDEESLIADADKHDAQGMSFQLLGQRVEYSDKTDWLKLSVSELNGTRVKVEGHWRGSHKFSARTIARRPEGRDRITGRIDAIQRSTAGQELELMSFRVFLPKSVQVEAERPLESYAFAEERKVQSADRIRDEDDFLPGTHRLASDLHLGLRLEWNEDYERDHDLNEDDKGNRIDSDLTLRGELTWTPTENFYGLLGVRGTLSWREDEEDGYSTGDDASLSEAFGYFRDVGLAGFDLQVGRQDFDEEREWLYDQNMDAIRAIYTRDIYRAELSASTNFTDASTRDQNMENLIAYVSRDVSDRVLAAYIIDRRDDRDEDDYPLYLGARALGEWLPEAEIWAEYSILRGYRGDLDYEGFAYDLGMTWEGDVIEPYYLTLGWAFGSGDDDPNDGNNEAFLQTGLNDNNGKFGGVTSFRYYGEILDPELSNLAVLTLGVGRRFGQRNSIDLVWHQYTQDVAADRLVNADLKRRPNGLDRDLGWELDLIAGTRIYDGLDLEIVLATFEPGDAFANHDNAWLLGFQARFRL